jgi:hypothetical protein
MTDPLTQPAIPAPADRTALNAALLATGADTGFWDQHGHPAPWPDDIDEWTPVISKPTAREPGQQPF